MSFSYKRNKPNRSWYFRKRGKGSQIPNNTNGPAPQSTDSHTDTLIDNKVSITPAFTITRPCKNNFSLSSVKSAHNTHTREPPARAYVRASRAHHAARVIRESVCGFTNGIRENSAPRAVAYAYAAHANPLDSRISQLDPHARSHDSPRSARASAILYTSCYIYYIICTRRENKGL